MTASAPSLRQTCAGLRLLLVAHRAARPRLPARSSRHRPGRVHAGPNGSLVDRRRRQASGRVVGADRAAASTGAAVVPARARRRPATATTRSPRRRPTSGPSTPTCIRPSSDRTGRGRRARRRRRRPRAAGRGHRLGSGLDPDISPAYADQQVARVAAARGLTGRDGAALVDDHTTGRAPRLPRRAARQRPGAEPRPRRAAARRGRMDAVRRRAGRLRVYLGAAPGRRQDLRHARRGPAPARTAAPTSSSASSRPTAGRTTAPLLEGLEVVPRRKLAYRGATFTEMDLDAVLARHPQVALVDELAHTNVPGTRHDKRWQDVEELLDAGIDVITTVNIQHLESLNDVVAADHRRPAAGDHPRRGGAPRRPDRDRRHRPGGAAPADGARQHLPARAGRRRAVELLPRRQPHRAARAGPAVGRRAGRRGPAALPRRTTASTSPGRPASGSSSRSPAAPRARRCIRRAARIAARTAGADLLAVHVVRSRRPRRRRPGRARPPARAAESLGGSWHQVVGDDVADRPARLRPGRERHPDRARRQQPRPAGDVPGRRGHRRPGHPAVRPRSTCTWSPTRQAGGAGGPRLPALAPRPQPHGAGCRASRSPSCCCRC